MTDDTLRTALLRIYDMAEDRPDIRGVARAALAASAPDEGPRLPPPDPALMGTEYGPLTPQQLDEIRKRDANYKWNTSPHRDRRALLGYIDARLAVPEALDVERLAKAFHVLHSPFDEAQCVERDLEDAALMAAKYAALQEKRP